MSEATPDVIVEQTLGQFRYLADAQPLLYVSIPEENGRPVTCVGYCFAISGGWPCIAMRRKNATWGDNFKHSSVGFAIGSTEFDASQVSGIAEMTCGFYSEEPWAAAAWDAIDRRYDWFIKEQLDGDPLVLKLVPKSLTLLRYDKMADALWRTVIERASEDVYWSVREHGAKSRSHA